MPDLAVRVTPDDVRRMTARLYVTEGEDVARKWTAFWVLLVLAAVIATAGVVGDSTATVIGAMIVAPLMTPILGTALALVLGHRRALLKSVALVLAAAAVVVGIAYLVGLLEVGPIVADTNSQVAGRVSPRLLDLLAALATGAVGAFALVRSDVSDTLPGVAIAISLVPPLAVVGLTLESGQERQAMGALLLFGTNVAAIVATGTLVLLLSRVRHVALDAGLEVGRLGGSTLAAVVALVVLVAVPLTVGTRSVVLGEIAVNEAQPVVEEWATQAGWLTTSVGFRNGALTVDAVGPDPRPDPAELRQRLDDAGLRDLAVRATLVIGTQAVLPAH